MTFTPKQALAQLSNDYRTILTVSYAQEICEAFGIPISVELIMRWKNADDAADVYKFYAFDDKPGMGIGAVELSNYICTQLGIVPPPGDRFFGKGKKIDYNIAAIKEKLGIESEHPLRQFLESMNLEIPWDT